MTKSLVPEAKGNSEAPDLWILTVCLNDKEGLAQTLWSISGQVGVRIGVVIADGGSVDGTLELADAFSRNWAPSLVLPGPDGGIYQGMNRALQAAPDESLVWFLNAGDFLADPRAAQRALAAAAAGAEWAGGPIISVRPSDIVHGVTACPTLPSQRPPVRPAQPSVIARKSALLACGGFREDLRLASDGVLIEQLAARYPWTVYTVPSVIFPLGGRSSSQISQTLAELRSATSDLDSAPPRAHEVWTILKTRLRESVFALADSKLSPLPRTAASAARQVQHWPHTDPAPTSVACCREAAAAYLAHLQRSEQ